jgi:hypothetical protein
MRQVVIAVTKRTSLLGACTSIRHAHLSGMHIAQACTSLRHAPQSGMHFSIPLWVLHICTYMEESSKDLTPSHDKLKRIVWFLLPMDNIPLSGRGLRDVYRYHRHLFIFFSFGFPCVLDQLTSKDGALW